MMKMTVIELAIVVVMKKIIVFYDVSDFNSLFCDVLSTEGSLILYVSGNIESPVNVSGLYLVIQEIHV